MRFNSSAFRTLSCFFTAVIAIISVPVASAEIDALDFDDDGTAIVISGEIVEGDAERFRREAARHDDAVVFLQGDGGALLDAIEIGEAIRLRGYRT